MSQGTSAFEKGKPPFKTSPSLPESDDSGNVDFIPGPDPKGRALSLWKPSPRRSASGHLTRAFLPLDPDPPCAGGMPPGDLPPHPRRTHSRRPPPPHHD